VWSISTILLRHRGNEVAPGAPGDSPLRRVLDEVSKAVGSLSRVVPVDLILNGHAHCLEYLRTGDTGHADSISTGSSAAAAVLARRQRSEGRSTETFAGTEGDRTRKVAESLLYVGRNGQGSQKRRPYSFCGSMSRWSTAQVHRPTVYC